MPEGTIPRGPAFFDPVLKGRFGRGPAGPAHRRAGDPGRAVGHRAGVAPQLAGAEGAQHRRRADRHRRVGKPVELKHRSLDADTKKIMKAIVKLLAQPRRATGRTRRLPDDSRRRLRRRYELDSCAGHGRRRRPLDTSGTSLRHRTAALCRQSPVCAVDRLADEVGVAAVAGVLLDHVDEDPAQRDARSRGCDGRDEVVAVGDRGAAALDRARE